jgi:hypothetical protein
MNYLGFDLNHLSLFNFMPSQEEPVYSHTLYNFFPDRKSILMESCSGSFLEIKATTLSIIGIVLNFFTGQYREVSLNNGLTCYIDIKDLSEQLETFAQTHCENGQLPTAYKTNELAIKDYFSTPHQRLENLNNLWLLSTHINQPYESDDEVCSRVSSDNELSTLASDPYDEGSISDGSSEYSTTAVSEDFEYRPLRSIDRLPLAPLAQRVIFGMIFRL